MNPKSSFFNLLIVVAMLLGVLGNGCTTQQADSFWSNVQSFQANSNVQAAELAAAKLALQFALASATGTQINTQWAAQTVLNDLSSTVPSMTNDQAATAIATGVDNAGTAPQLRRARRVNIAKPSTLGERLAAAFLQANPKSPAERTAVVLALSKGVSAGTTKATGQLP